MDYIGRLDSVKHGIKLNKLDSFLVTDQTNVSYLSGFQGHDSVILITENRNYFITDSRYIEEAENGLKGFDVRLAKGSMYIALKELIKKKKIKALGFESMNLPYEVASRLKTMADKTRFVPIRHLIENLRAIKDYDEIAAIKDSIKLAKKVMDKASELMRPSIAEKYVAREVESEFIKNGARASFEPIIAAGENSSKPHARPTETRIMTGSFAMVDIGCSFNGYNSDITRMFVFGKVKDRFKKIYAVVKTAQDIAIKKIRPGTSMAEVDLSARRYIQDKGFGKYFGHSLGHGVGMSVHEEPTISRSSESYLRKGMVFTVEPAVYIPKFGGVRIEDMVMVTESGCEVLTR